jgi:hypothetical protein
MSRVLVALLLLLVAGCGPQLVQADVTRFNALPPESRVRSFTILPEQGQIGSLEFQNYAQLVAAQLESNGWQPVAPTAGAEPDALVYLHWGIGPAHTETWSSPSSVYGGYGWGPHPWYGGAFYDPFPYWDTYSVTTFPKWLAVDILDGHGRRGGKLFEGRAITEGRSPAIAPAMPYLVKALFTGFPGGNGQTVRVSIPVAQ